ncbi:MAG: hypothetical protein V4584_05065 [Verrucomicrobiota bacterium]
MMKPSPTLWLGLFLIGACGAGGYAAGSAGISPEKDAGGGKREISRAERTSPRERRAEDALGNYGRLLAGKEEQIWQAVSRLAVADLPEALRRLRAMRALTASWSNGEKRLDEIESALYFKWAESDPVAALADVSGMPGPPDHAAAARRAELVRSVLAAWMRVDANAAYRAVKDDKALGYVGRDMLVQTWTAENVFENLKLFPDKNRDLLGWYCVAAAKDEAQRNAMLAALKEQPEMRDRDWGYFMLFRDWAYRDFPAAMAEAKQHDEPGLEQHVLEDGLNQQPAATMRWAVSQNIPPGGPRWTEGYGNWLMFDPADAKAWLDQQAPAWEEAGHFAAVADFRTQQLSSMEKIDMKAVQPAWLDLMTKWRNKDPDAAEKWLGDKTAHSQGISSILKWKDTDAHE